MPNRFDRILPWALVAVMGALLLMGIAWDAAFEATPANTDLVSQGDDRIRELKVEIGDRGEDELCWGTGATAGCPVGDSGFAREGSARGFFANANPATLNNQAATALGANHDGRIYFDDDGADNVNANNDDNQLKVYDGTAWAAPRWESLGGITLTGVADNDILRYESTGPVLVNQPVATLITFDRATLQADEAFVNGACTACTVVDVPDHVGGSDTNNYAEVTVPSAPSGVVWDIYVDGHMMMFWDSSDGGGIVCEIEQDVNDADTFATTLTGVPTVEPLNANFAICYFSAVVRGATAGSSYAFRLKHNQPLGTEDYTVEYGGGLASGEGHSEIRAEVRPRTIF